MAILTNSMSKYGLTFGDFNENQADFIIYLIPSETGVLFILQKPSLFQLFRQKQGCYKISLRIRMYPETYFLLKCKIDIKLWRFKSETILEVGTSYSYLIIDNDLCCITAVSGNDLEPADRVIGKCNSVA